MENELTIILDNGILSNPGDEISARITPTGRKVVKVKKMGKRLVQHDTKAEKPYIHLVHD